MLGLVCARGLILVRASDLAAGGGTRIGGHGFTGDKVMQTHYLPISGLVCARGQMLVRASALAAGGGARLATTAPEEAYKSPCANSFKLPLYRVACLYKRM